MEAYGSMRCNSREDIENIRVRVNMSWEHTCRQCMILYSHPPTPIYTYIYHTQNIYTYSFEVIWTYDQSQENWYANIGCYNIILGENEINIILGDHETYQYNMIPDFISYFIWIWIWIRFEFELKYLDLCSSGCSRSRLV